MVATGLVAAVPAPKLQLQVAEGDSEIDPEIGASDNSSQATKRAFPWNPAQ
jgi:hypothetical protein